MEQYEAIVKHPYIDRQNKHFILLNNAEQETVETFITASTLLKSYVLAVIKCMRNCCRYLKSFIHW